MKRIAFLALSGCSQILGLTEPKQEGDAGVPGDAPPDAPLPGTVKITMGGTGVQGRVTSEPAGIDCPGTCEFTFPVGTEVTLSATDPAQNQVFTGFVQGGCHGEQSCTITPVGAVEVFARYWSQANLWFTTSTVQKPGAFDNVADADMLCDTLAANAGLIERDYRAWLSTSTDSAIQRLNQLSVGPQPNGWSRVDNKRFADGQTALTQGKILFPPRLDEFGRDVGDDAIVVTDTTSMGVGGPGNHCNDWASEVSTPVLSGEPAGGTRRWTELGTSPCNADARLYCFSAVLNDPFATPPLTASVVFVSDGTVDGAAGVAAMDVMCKNEAGPAGLPGEAFALVSPGGGKTVKQRFEDDDISFTSDLVVRPDSTVIAPDMATLLDTGVFEVAPNVDALKVFRDVDVWIGGGGFNNFQTDCAGWTSTSGSGASRPAATTRAPTFFVGSSCVQQKHVLCFVGVIAVSKPKPPSPGLRDGLELRLPLGEARR